jgi:peptidoglycan/xylan/chitin deacetylase (PgdA/CDA1 family)
MNFVFKAISRLISLLGIHQIVRFLKRHKTTFILYHNPEPVIFRRHIEYLSKSYTIISLEEFLDYKNNPKGKMPDYSMVITFDDGHKGNFLLTDIIASFNIKPTIYVCSGIVCTNRKFWFKLEGIQVRGLKKMDDTQRIKHLKQAVNFSYEDEFSALERHALTQEELTQMNPYVDFQSHTQSHPILTTCDADTVYHEILQSRLELTEKINSPVRHFAYPNGDYSKREIELLKKAGYQSARTTDVGWNDKTTDPFQLKITGVNDHAPLWMLKAELTGIPGYIYNVYKSGITVRALKGRHVPERNLE